jgi:phosphohistidine phosphatase SixA
MPVKTLSGLLLHRLLLPIVAVLAFAGAARADAGAEAAWTVLSQGGVVLFRHANAPGGGDPEGMRLGDCSTQRNLDAEGRAQAARIGEAFRARAIAVGAVLVSQWCRTTETAAIAFPGQGKAEPAFNSFFGRPADGPAQTRAALAVLDAWRGPGALVVSTHQVNITALTGIFPASGEGIVLDRRNGAWMVVGRIRP